MNRIKLVEKNIFRTQFKNKRYTFQLKKTAQKTINAIMLEKTCFDTTIKIKLQRVVWKVIKKKIFNPIYSSLIEFFNICGYLWKRTLWLLLPAIWLKPEGWLLTAFCCDIDNGKKIKNQLRKNITLSRINFLLYFLIH